VIAENIRFELNEALPCSSLTQRTAANKCRQPSAHCKNRACAGSFGNEANRGVVLVVHGPHKCYPSKQTADFLCGDIGLSLLYLSQIFISKGLGVSGKSPEIAVVFEMLNGKRKPHWETCETRAQLTSGVA
jgi:hypothetical protein